MKTLPLALSCIFLLAGTISCSISQPIHNAPSNNNPTYNVSYLFEHEGIKVYRFMDQGNWVYFTNCGGEITSVTNDSVQIRTQTINDKKP